LDVHASYSVARETEINRRGTQEWDKTALERLNQRDFQHEMPCDPFWGRMTEINILLEYKFMVL